MLDVRPGDIATVLSILRSGLEEGSRAWVFGSRAKGTARRGSDLDLAIDAGRSLTLHDLAVLNTAFDDSNLPYAVDVLDWRSADPAFRAMVEADRVELDLAEPARPSGV
jgi:predicted nucleotidyltransferase